MDLYFVPTTGRPFPMEVGYFDTILEIKEKIEKYQKIPVEKQTLIFNNQTLADDLDIHTTEIVDNTRIEVIISADPTTPEKPAAAIKVKQESSPPLATPSPPPPQPQPATPSKKIKLVLKIPTAKLRMEMELEVNDSIRRLKEKVNEVDKGFPVGKIVARSNGVELQDHNTLKECGLLDNSEIDISIKRSSPTTSLNATTNNNNNNNNTNNNNNNSNTNTNNNNNNNSNNNNSPKKLKIMVLTKCGTKKIPVEVNVSDNVGELRKELQKVNQWGQLHLPQDGFFFIYKQNVMDEDRSFRWHHVGHGDTIEIFNGSITGGS